jgi:hypothetical protein
LPLEAPRELRVLDFFCAHQENVFVNLFIRLRRSLWLKVNQDFHSVGSRPRVKRKQRMFVSLQFRSNLLRQGFHGWLRLPRRA